MPTEHPLELRLLQLLREQPGGVTEYTLLRQLQAEGWLAEHRLSDTLGLFRAHFLLFHHLHRLRCGLLTARLGDLTITALEIQLHPYTPGTAALTAADPLLSYYLHEGHLATTTAAEVQALLDRFFSLAHAREGRAGALTTLGLSDPVDDTAIRHRYRQLAMRYHPDRGGSDEQLKRINAAMALLRCRSL